MSKKYIINNNALKLSGRKFLLETIVSIPSKNIDKQSVYVAILTVDKIEDGVYGYALDGFNHISENEFSFAEICTLEELKVKFSKFKINFKEEK